MTDHITTRELPLSERPYEKCLQYGAQALSDAELLAVIIKSGSCGMNAIGLAQRILQSGTQNLLNLHQMSIQELMQFPGIGEVKAIQLKCVAEISRRLARTNRLTQLEMSRPQTVAAYYMEQLRHETTEHLMLSMFDLKCRLIADCIIASGSVRAVLTSPREVFLELLSHKAVSFILLHNHPSGDPMPSRDDMLLTERMHECGKLLDITLSDHIIIGDNRYYSFRENKQILV